MTIPLAYPFADTKTVSLVPIVDARDDKKASVNFDKLQEKAQKILENKGYEVTLAEASDALSGVNTDDLKEATPDFVRGLGSPRDRWVMVLCLNDVASKMTFGSTGNAEMTGFLFDKQSGKLAWSNKGIGQAGQGGLAGMMMKGMMKGEALAGALWHVLSSVPPQPRSTR